MRLSRSGTPRHVGCPGSTGPRHARLSRRLHGEAPSSSTTASTPIRWGSPMWRQACAPTRSCEPAPRAPKRSAGCGSRPYPSIRSTADRHYHVNLALPIRRLVRASAKSVEIIVGSDSPSFGIVKWLELGSSAARSSLLPPVCAGRRDPGRRFHFQPITPRFVAAVREAHASGELAGEVAPWLTAANRLRVCAGIRSMSSVEIKTAERDRGAAPRVPAAAETLLHVGDLIRAGMTTEEINRIVHEDTFVASARPAPLNYHGFPKSVCTSVNEVVCHGIPGAQRPQRGRHHQRRRHHHLQRLSRRHLGDVLHRRSLRTRRGTSPRSRAARSSSGSPQVREGARLGDIGAAIQEYAEGARLLGRPRIRRSRHRSQVPRAAAGFARRYARRGHAPQSRNVSSPSSR